MKPSALCGALSIITALVISCGPRTDLALGTGGGNEGEARTVCGIVVDEAGSAEADIAVRLVPADYNPITGVTMPPVSKRAGLGSRLHDAKKSWDSLKATTDRYGYFEIKNVPFNTYHLVNEADEANDSLGHTIFAKVVVDSSASSIIDIDTIHEKQPGFIQLTILDSVATLNISLVVLGTGICVQVTHAGTYTISAPAGTLQLVCVWVNSISGAVEPLFRYDNIVIQENRTTVVSTGGGGGFAKCAIMLRIKE